jgi:hypothetical protein
LVVGALALSLGLVTDQLVTLDAMPLHRLARESITPLELGSLAVLAILLVVTLARRGPRSLLAHVFETHRHDHAPHEHG